MLPSCGHFSLALLLVILFAGCASGAPVKVFAVPFTPFFLRVNGANSGIDHEVWSNVVSRVRAEIPDFEFEYEIASLGEVYEKVASTNMSFALGALTVSSKRLGTVDYSSPYLSGGLDVIVRNKRQDLSFMQFYNPMAPGVWVIMAILVGISGHVIWFMEVKYQPKIFPSNYFLGVNEGIWFCWGTLTATNQEELVGFPSRMYSVGWSTLTILMVATYTATLAASLTAARLDSGIDSVRKLGGSSVGSVQFSNGEEYMRNYMQNTEHKLYPDFEQCFDALLRGDVTGAVFDSPVLVHYQEKYIRRQEEETENRGASSDTLTYLEIDNLDVLGADLSNHRYGIAMHAGHPYRSAVDRAISTLQEDGTLNAIRRNYLYNNVDLSGVVRVPLKEEKAFVPLEFYGAVGIFLLLVASFFVAVVSWFLLQFGHLLF